jgi:hypothetical protein
MKHGLTAMTLIIAGEDPKEFEQLLEHFTASFQPIDAIEMELVGQLTVAAWRLRRTHRIEADLFKVATKVDEERTKANAEADAKAKQSDYSAALIDYEDLMNSHRLDPFLPFDQLGRYAANAERSFYRALQVLEHLREKRVIKDVSPLAETKTD